MTKDIEQNIYKIFLSLRVAGGWEALSVLHSTQTQGPCGRATQGMPVQAAHLFLVSQ